MQRRPPAPGDDVKRSEGEPLLGVTVRFEDHFRDVPVENEPGRTTRSPHLPQDFAPFLQEGERVVSVETIVGSDGFRHARVWIERAG